MASIFLGIIHNAALLLAVSMIYENLWMKTEKDRKLPGKILTGLLTGSIAVVLMFTPWTYIPGISFDTRSVLLSVSGLFFGGIPTLVAAVITGVTRFIMGGEGVWMGLMVVITSSLTGLIWRIYRAKQLDARPVRELLSMGLLTHMLMLACTSFLPADKVLPTLTTILLPVLLIYTPATLLLGYIMIQQRKNWLNRLAGEKLRETERRLREILKSGNILSALHDETGNIVFCNPALLELTGYSEAEVTGRKWFDFFLPVEYRPEIEKRYLLAMKEGLGSRTFEGQMLKKTGEIIYVLWYNTILKDEHGKSEGVAAIGIDLTLRKVYEEKLKEKSGELEIRNRELEMAKEKAEESDRLKSTFLANLSHEVRTPMNAIIGFSELLGDVDLSADKKQSYISIIQKSSNQLLTIINDVIEMSKIETGQVSLHLSEVNLVTFMDELYQTFVPGLRGDTNLLKYYRKDLLIDPVITDEQKLQQILSNIIGNALKFTDEGIVEFWYEHAEPDMIEFYVRDNGPGIAKEDQELIFQRFHKAGLSSSSFKAGSGLGLPISRSFTELLGGRIRVESEPGKGSLFIVSIKNQPANKA